jgi:hypothetical protein
MFSLWDGRIVELKNIFVMVNQLQQTKLAYLAQKLGFDLRDTQQTHRRVYDTVNISGNGQFSFFTNFAGKTLADTNLTSGKLDSSEAFVIKQIGFDDPGLSEYFNGGANYSVLIGGQTVIKKFPLVLATDPLSMEQVTDTRDIVTGESVPNMRLLTNVVVPPQVEFELILENFTGNIGEISCFLDGFGVIFNPQMSL